MQDTITPFPHQIDGAAFLAARKVALLADEQRVGKTGAAIRACDYVMAETILVVTKASARAQWGREFRVWGFPRDVQVVYSGTDKINDPQVVVVAWSMVFNDALWVELIGFNWDVLILDECHEAKNFVAKRTMTVYGRTEDDGLTWNREAALCSQAVHVWPLSGTPIPNAPNDLYPLLRALAPERLKADPDKLWPDVSTHSDFVGRYCVVKMRRLGGVMRPVIKGGKNLEELNARVEGLWLRRTQADVGIRAPIFSVLALHVDKLPPEMTADLDVGLVLAAAETDETASLEMHLGSLRRITGTIKAHAVVEAAREQLADRSIDKLVLMAWHTDVLDILWDGLAQFGVTGIDGSTAPTRRDEAVRSFQNDANKRVFVGQIVAAGEAIDLSAAAELWFIEPSFVPKDMSQAAMRITNHSQKRQALVRVCALEGSIDEALMAILTRKVETIRKVMEH